MKKLFVYLLLLWPPVLLAQAEENAWQGINAIGSVNQVGVYGTQGVPSETTTPGGRDSASSWIDSKGNLWLFGGENCLSNCKGSLNDLWKFDSITRQWTWVTGADTFNSQGSNTIPNARFGATSWIDTSDNLWLFGGVGQGNDLWKFNPPTSQWTRLNGNTTISYGTQGISSSTNRPGGREFAVSGTEASGAVWLFGGFGSTVSGYSAGYLNDLWKFDPITDQWVWISGSNQPNPPGSYGTQGVANGTNVPSGRFAAASWMDSRGNLWIFGGEGYDAHGSFGYLNDLWQFDSNTTQWTWVSGANTAEQKSSYGTQGLPSETNDPGARAFTGSWIDTNDNLWLTDGNEVWRFDTKTCQWTWMSGTIATTSQKDNTTPTSPGYRSRLNVWFAQDNQLWLFGGTQGGEMGDLWEHDSF